MKKQVFLITGASSGIGKATALLLHNKGYILYAIARRLEKMQDLQLLGVTVKSIDVTDEDRLKSMVDEIITEHGQIDGLINNAGINIFGSLEETPVTEARKLFDVNVFAYARLTQLVLPHMRAQRSGIILNVGSIAGFIVMPTNGWYCASKFALEAMTDALRMEVRNLGIKVILIEPEVIKTDIGTPALISLNRYVPIEDYAFFTSKWAKMVPYSLNRGAPPELVAKTIFKALQARKPRSRYFIPSYSKFIPFLKKVLPDKWVDRLTIFILTQLAKRS